MAPKPAAPNGAAPKGKHSKPAPNGPTAVAKPDTTTPAPTTSGSSRPDKAAYDAEQDKIKVEIDALQSKLSAVRDKINGVTKSAGDERRIKLKAELDEIRHQQASGKSSRGKTLDQLKALNESIGKKVKDLNNAKAKTPFKTVAEIDAHIKALDARIESGSMKMAEEKKAISEISQIKRSRRTVESFQKEQESIDADRAAADELRKQLDDPEAKAASDRYDAIRAELDELKKEGDEQYANRQKLFDERTALQAQLDTLYGQKRDSSTKFREANDRFYAKLNEDKARRAERARAERTAQEAEKKTALATKIREEASIPAFQAQIEDCQTLIDYFLGRSSTATPSNATPAVLTPKADVVGVPKLELRQIDATEGLVVGKKKGEEDSYFVGSKAKKGKKGGAKTPVPEADAPSSSGKLNLPMPTLTALFSLSIPPPTSSAEVPRVVEDLKTKKAWFEANQDRVTRENIAKAEADIERLTGAKADAKNPLTIDVVPPAGGGERPAEPASTPSVTDTKSIPVSSSEVVDKLEDVQEQQAEAEVEDS